MNRLAPLVTAVVIISTTDLSATTQTWAQKKQDSPPFEQGYGLSEKQFPAGYNASAKINVEQSWDFFFTGSFTYWYVDELGFDLAINGAVSPEQILFQTNSYSPGFKLGVGMDFKYDGWVGFLEYTWLRNHSTFSTSGSSLTVTNLFVFDLSTTALGGSRHVDLDLIDASLGRPLYEGRNITLLPSFGLRSAWLRQNFRGTTSSTTTYTHSNSHSWFIGPRAGLAAHWLVGWGFRLEGDLAGSLLFQQAEANFRIATTYGANNQNILAPVADAALGLGWGTYLKKQNYHLDFVATYDFMNWWNQNLIRALADTAQVSSGFAPADLQISGLTLTGRFDF